MLILTALYTHGYLIELILVYKNYVNSLGPRPSACHFANDIYNLFSVLFKFHSGVFIGVIIWTNELVY